MFAKILIARRGEAAARVARTCRWLGITAVALYSQKGESVQVDACDLSFEIEPGGDGRLSATSVVAIARQAEVDAVYPGYGAHTAHSALTVELEQAEMLCVGQDPDAIALLCDRTALWALCDELEIPRLEGGVVRSLDDAEGLAYELGYPLRLSEVSVPSRQTLVVSDSDELAEAFARVNVPEAGMILHREFVRPRRIEVLVAIDQEGEVVALAERETSARDANGKALVVESPSPELVFRADGDAIREILFDYAIRIGQRVAVPGLFAVEFLLSRDGEIAARSARLGLPSLHGAIEMVTGIDLVALELELASGGEISDEARAANPNGHAISAAILATDPSQRELAPEEVIIPGGPQRILRVEPSALTGFPVPADDWPRLAKITTAGATRHQAALQLDRVLAATSFPPLATNVKLVRRVLNDERFRAGEYDTEVALRAVGASA